MTKAKSSPTPMPPEEIDRWNQKFRRLSNSARYDEAYALARRLLKKNPGVILFAYYEAVMTAEDDASYSPAELKRRYRSAAGKLRKLLFRARAMTPRMRDRARNEYYWFSQQPLKQYHLGRARVQNGDKLAYYSQGVGAAQLAKRYALQGRKGLSVKWAKISEHAWKSYFRAMPHWYNSYLFYAAALGYQGRFKEMDAAFAKAARVAGKPKGWKALATYRADVMRVYAALSKGED